MHANSSGEFSLGLVEFSLILTHFSLVLTLQITMLVHVFGRYLIVKIELICPKIWLKEVQG